MFITNQYKMVVNLADAAATNDANAATGIAAGGPYNGANVATNVATGAQTAIGVGNGVCPLLTTQATIIPFTTTCNYYLLDLQGAVVVAGQPHTFKLTHFNLHIDPNEYVLDFKLTCSEVDATSDINFTAMPAAPNVNYNRAQQAFFITISNAAAAVFVNTQNLILAVVFGRQN